MEMNKKGYQAVFPGALYAGFGSLLEIPDILVREGAGKAVLLLDDALKENSEIRGLQERLGASLAGTLTGLPIEPSRDSIRGVYDVVLEKGGDLLIAAGGGSIMDMAINDGKNPLNGEQSSLHTGFLYDMTCIEQVRDAVKQMATHIMRMFVTTQNYAEHLNKFFAPESVLSLSIEGCMEKGKDVVRGGAKYNSFGGTATGLATVADSLTTIKYMCFDKKLCTTRELYDATMANWEGHEKLRQQILAQVPHFGNNDPYADVEMKWCVDLYRDICKQMYTTRSKVFKAGLYGASDHVNQGRLTWGTPDGRKYPEPIADAASPGQSRDKSGPLQIFNSSCCYDHGGFMGGIALNMRMHPSVLSNDEGIKKLGEVTKEYFRKGSMEIQYNVVDTETLKKAQAEPEKYRDLVVRIAGYSAYFVELGRDLQNDIISRNELTV